MAFDPQTVFGFASALGGGLLIGVERERRKGFGPQRALAGVRSFTLAALAGAVAASFDNAMLSAAGALFIGALAALGYWRSRQKDPGITTEIALFITYLLGVLAMSRPGLSAGAAVVVAGLLAGRTALHRFSVDVLTDTELRDGLLFAAMTLILLPLLPDQPTRWLLGGNPRQLFTLVITFMALQAVGYVGLRIAGPRLGLAVSGLAAGFVSSTGTIAALGARVRNQPAMLGACVSGAIFSSVATVLLLGVVVAAVYPPAFAVLGVSLAVALVAALGVAALSLLKQEKSLDLHAAGGRAFNVRHALGFAALLSAATALMSFVRGQFGAGAVTLTTALAGFFDVHAACASTLALASKTGSAPTLPQLALAVLLAFSANTISKLVAAFWAGGLRYGVRVGAGLLVIAAGAWAPLLWEYSRQ